jgi:UDP:flavonoid glycosyltransferase YjiC (YdhE family)
VRRAGTRVLLVAPPFSGHINPLMVVAAGLRDRGMDPRFVTGPAKAGPLRSLGFPTTTLLGEDPQAFERISDTAVPVRSNPFRMTRQLSANLALAPAVRAELRAIVRRESPDVVLADMTAAVAGQVADEAGLPWLTVMPTPFALETRSGTPSYCGGWGRPRHAGHRLRDALGRGATRAAKLTMQRVLARQFLDAGLSVYRADGSERAYSPYGILGLGMDELELPRDWPDVFEMIGPVTATPGPWSLVPELPGGRCVLVTYGTHLRWAKPDLVPQVRRLADAFRDVTFVVSLGEPARAAAAPADAPVGVGGNVVVHRHLPYDDVVPRCAAVIHHGGAGITYSTIRAGRPALVCPQDYDQFDFAARIVDAGAGVAVRSLDHATGALARVLAMDTGPVRALACALTRYDPVSAVERAVRRVLASRPGTGEPAVPDGASPTDRVAADQRG